MATLVYASLTGNTARFMQKIANLRPTWRLVKLTPELELGEHFHLVTFTTGLGEIPPMVEKFLAKNSAHLLSVTASGNMNWGKTFGVAGDKISEKYQVPLLMKYELAGNQKTAEKLINKIEEFSHGS